MAAFLRVKRSETSGSSSVRKTFNRQIKRLKTCVGITSVLRRYRIGADFRAKRPEQGVRQGSVHQG
ncbi:hypothetical protein [Salinihabitans flavidus]|uniref:hypothetical protein n=1 Tax=Salinihabitans flavidus TaxID=569882 RepID=UPI001113BE5C|nr:hypothetical protein [Salinihabitans flavidus]